MAEDLKNTILLGDFGTVENKELFERGLFSRIKPKIGSWRSRCYETTLQSPYKTASFRSVVFNRAKDPNSYVLLEGIVIFSSFVISFFTKSLLVLLKTTLPFSVRISSVICMLFLYSSSISLFFIFNL